MESVVIDAVRRCCATSGAKSPLAAGANQCEHGRGIARHVKRAADHVEDNPAGECHLCRLVRSRMTDRDGDGAVDEPPFKGR